MLLAWPGLWLRSFGLLRCSDFLKTLLRSEEMLLSAEVFLLSLISSLYLMIFSIKSGTVNSLPFVTGFGTIHTLGMECARNHWRISCLCKDCIQAFVRLTDLILEINKLLLFGVLGIQ